MLQRVGKTGDEDKEFKDRFIAHINTSSKSVPLMIKNLCVSDSAVYYCALRIAQVKPHTTAQSLNIDVFVSLQ